MYKVYSSDILKYKLWPVVRQRYGVLRTNMLCYVIGSRWLMPPDALQPNAYSTNPGLQSFLLAPQGFSTRDPSSERRNYLGEKWPVISTEICYFHEFFYMSQVCDMGQTDLLPFRSIENFFPSWKIRRLRSGLNQRTWVPKASTLPLDHRSCWGHITLTHEQARCRQHHTWWKVLYASYRTVGVEREPGLALTGSENFALTRKRSPDLLAHSEDLHRLGDEGCQRL